MGLLEAYVNPEDIPLICSLAISQHFHQDGFCWSFTKSGTYSVKSGYRVARNLLRDKSEVEFTEPSIRALQAQAWKVKAPQKIRHLIWQIASGHLAVTRNLNQRGLRCTNQCPRCNALNETINHAFFECPLAARTWNLAHTPTSPDVFPTSALYTNLDYLYWRKPDNGTLASGEESFPWILWFIWKARNDKLFRGINREPEDIFRHAVSESSAWHTANKSETPRGAPRTQGLVTTQKPSNICLLDGSWTADGRFSGLGWAWMGADGLHIRLGARNLHRRLSPLHSEVEAIRWAMISLQDQSAVQCFGTDCQDLIEMIQNPGDWPSFSTELIDIGHLKRAYPSFSLIYVPQLFNSLADSLAKLARAFVSPVSFSGCSIPEWLAIPPQV